jgi:hypothetical protein
VFKIAFLNIVFRAHERKKCDPQRPKFAPAIGPGIKAQVSAVHELRRAQQLQFERSVRWLSCGLICAVLLATTVFDNYWRFSIGLKMVAPPRLRCAAHDNVWDGGGTPNCLAQPEGRAFLTLIKCQIRRESWPFRRIRVTRL